MRGARNAGAALLAGMLATVAWVGLLLAAPSGAWAETTTLPGTLTTAAEQTGPLTLGIPAGTTPTAITGVLSMPSVVDGSSVSILLNGRVARTVPSTLYTKVRVPLQAGDVVADGTVAVSIRYDAPAGATGCEPVPDITLRKLGLDYTGTETPPDSVSTFFPDDAARIDVQVPPDSSDDVLQAALNAVAALSHRYGADTPVVLSSTEQPLPTTAAGQRVVRIQASSQDVTATLGATGPVPVLVLSGSGLPLSDAARSLGSDELSLAAGGEAGGLAQQVETRDDGLTRTFDQLREDSPAPVATASGTQVLEIRQDSFGTPTSALRVHLEGTHSAVPAGAAARLDVYLDDELVGSSVLGADPEVDLDLTIGSGFLQSTNVLRATISSATDASATCSPSLPLELSLDGDASTVTATAGTGSLRGFQLFPQALDGRLPIALRPVGTARLTAAVEAGALVSALQAQAAAPLDVTIVDPDDFVASDRSGLLVGADDGDSVDINAPLRLSGTRLLSSERTKFEVASDAPFAALEATNQTGRSVLLLGSWAPGDVAADPALTAKIVSRIAEDGWGSLTDDVVVADSKGPPYAVDSGARAALVEPADEQGDDPSYLRWFIAGIALLLLLLGLQVLRAVRRDRRRRAARAAEADADGAGPTPTEPAAVAAPATATPPAPVAPVVPPVQEPTPEPEPVSEPAPKPEPEPVADETAHGTADEDEEPTPTRRRRRFAIFRANVDYQDDPADLPPGAHGEDGQDTAPDAEDWDEEDDWDDDRDEDEDWDDEDDLEAVGTEHSSEEQSGEEQSGDETTLSRGRQPWVHLRRPDQR